MTLNLINIRDYFPQTIDTPSDYQNDETELYVAQSALYHPHYLKTNGKKRQPLILSHNPISIFECQNKIYWRIGDQGYIQKMRLGEITRPSTHHINPISTEQLSRRAIELMFYDAIRIKSTEKITDENLLTWGLGPNKPTLEHICTHLNLY